MAGSWEGCLSSSVCGVLLEFKVTSIVGLFRLQQSPNMTLFAVKATAIVHQVCTCHRSPKPIKLSSLHHMALTLVLPSISVPSMLQAWSCCGLGTAYRQGGGLCSRNHYLGILALREEVCAQWAACSEPHELVPGASWGSLAQGGDALGPSSTWHGAGAAGAQLHLSAPHPSPCNSFKLASFFLQPC